MTLPYIYFSMRRDIIDITQIQEGAMRIPDDIKRYVKSKHIDTIDLS